MDSLVQSPFYQHPDTLVAMGHFLEPKEYLQLGITCTFFKQIIICNDIYWNGWCLREGHLSRESEKSYFTFCRMENALYRRGLALGNLEFTLQCFPVSSITGIQEDPTFQRRAVNPLNGNLLCIASAPDSTFPKSDRSEESFDDQLERPRPKELQDSSSFKDFEMELHSSPLSVLNDRECGLAYVHEIAADSGKIVTSACLTKFSLDVNNIKKMRVVSNKILLISNQIFFAIDLQSRHIIKSVEFPNHLKCIDVIEFNACYLFLNHHPNGSEIYFLDDKSNHFYFVDMGIESTLCFCENVHRTVICYNTSQLNEMYCLPLNNLSIKLDLGCLIGKFAPTCFMIEPDDSESVTVIDRRFIAFVSKGYKDMFIWDQKNSTCRAIEIPPYQSTFHLGVRDDDLILYIDFQIYSIKTTQNSSTRFHISSPLI